MNNLKNYTSEVDAHISMGRIEKLLVEAGATDISKSYDGNQVCTAMRFRMSINNLPVFFQLPANVEACRQVMMEEIKRPRGDTAERIRKQAMRTAWKILNDWVEVQLSMIRLDQAKPLQVFLPYVWNPEKNETLYDRIAGNQQKMLTW